MTGQRPTRSGRYFTRAGLVRRSPSNCRIVLSRDQGAASAAHRSAQASYPCGPRGPGGPGGPGGPAGPVSPFGPDGPSLPGGPVTPAGPGGPAGPRLPCGPCGPNPATPPHCDETCGDRPPQHNEEHEPVLADQSPDRCSEPVKPVEPCFMHSIFPGTAALSYARIGRNAATSLLVRPSRSSCRSGGRSADQTPAWLPLSEVSQRAGRHVASAVRADRRVHS